MAFAASQIPRALAREFTLRNALSTTFKRPNKFITFHSFASHRQVVIKATVTTNRFFSTEQTNQAHQSSPKTNGTKPLLEESTKPEQPSTQKKPSGIHDYFTQNNKESGKTLPAFPIVLIFTASAIAFLGLYQYFYSNVNKYPEEIRKNLKKGLYYQNYRSDPTRAVNFYQTALTEAFNHAELDNSSPEVTGIMIQLGSLYEELGRVRDAVDVYTMAYDAIVTPNRTPVKLDGEKKLRSIGLAQKLGDLHQNLKQDEKAEKYFVWSVEQLLQSQHEVVQSNHDNINRDGLFSKGRDLTLPPWMTSTDLGASLEALATFYSSRHKYAYALPLYLRALSLINPPESSCHSAVLMNNISEVFTGMGNLEEAQGWAERGLKLVENFKQNRKNTECEEACGVLLFNLGMISELTGNFIKASEYYEKAREFAKKIGFRDCQYLCNNGVILPTSIIESPSLIFDYPSFLRELKFSDLYNGVTEWFSNVIGNLDELQTTFLKVLITEQLFKLFMSNCTNFDLLSLSDIPYEISMPLLPFLSGIGTCFTQLKTFHCVSKHRNKSGIFRAISQVSEFIETFVIGGVDSDMEVKALGVVLSETLGALKSQAKTLTTIQFEYCNFMPCDSMEALAAFENLEYLKFIHCIYIGDKMNSLTLAKFSNLKHLGFYTNHIESPRYWICPDDVAALIENCHNSLEKVMLPRSTSCIESYYRLVKALRLCRNIKDLKIQMEEGDTKDLLEMLKA
ncbi:6169_t:CDS:2 [Funneliformis mosseae]|uniref:6169_t:CDS:1 n=1 Tax=Funneliformis mosseae TaxID=27381 RepID=A0A9N8W9T8_FUNMO|nr:6169_t:CDS:2 [Funneliformis mosseae]